MLKYCLLCFTILLVGFTTYAQRNYMMPDFDEAYITSIKAENTALTARINTYHDDIREFNAKVTIAVRSKDDPLAIKLTFNIDRIRICRL